MLRHEFHPGKLVLGLFLLVASVAYAGDAGGIWETPWFVAFPLLLAGLLLGGAAAAVSYGIRGRPAARATDHTPPSTADLISDRPVDHTADRPVDHTADRPGGSSKDA
ncbi:hypothetical protein [Streptomyces sp. SYP-A7185]|uniref:hypothetical protein n=1 Tax=Streptomyces sp. SYP-A7185 TaxID=3040076 RepID=UPI0038F6A186